MQDKRGISTLAVAAVIGVVAIIGAGAVLMRVNVPAPAHEIQKPLDAKTFLGDKH